MEIGKRPLASPNVQMEAQTSVNKAKNATQGMGQWKFPMEKRCLTPTWAWWYQPQFMRHEFFLGGCMV